MGVRVAVAVGGTSVGVGVAKEAGALVSPMSRLEMLITLLAMVNASVKPRSTPLGLTSLSFVSSAPWFLGEIVIPPGSTIRMR